MSARLSYFYALHAQVQVQNIVITLERKYRDPQLMPGMVLLNQTTCARHVASES